MNSTFANRRAQFKAGLSQSSQRKSRADATDALRKNKRVEALRKRRNLRCVTSAEPLEPSAVPPPPAPVVGGSAAAATAATATTVAPPAVPGAPSPSDIPSLAAGVMSADGEAQFQGTFGLRRLLSKETNPPVKQVLDTGVLPRLIEFLGSPNVKLQFEAAWAITNIASTEYTGTVVKAGAVVPLVNYCKSPSPDVREQCLWCLGNIAGDGPEFRDLVLGTPGAVEGLLLNIKHPSSESLLKNATWTLSNYCRAKPPPALEAVRPLIPALGHLLNSKDVEILTDACWGLSYLTDGDDARIQAVVDAGLTPRLVQLLFHASPSVVIPALRATGNIVTGSDTQTQAVIDANGLAGFAALIRHARRNIRREACWASSNVAAGTQVQIQALVRTPGMMEALIHQLNHGEWAVKKEACWAVSNIATSGGDAAIHDICKFGVIPAFVSVLKVDDTKIVQVALEGVTSILQAHGPPDGGSDYSVQFEEAQGIDCLEQLQEHQSEQVYETAVQLIETYFGVEGEGEDENLAPTVADGGKTFAFGMPVAAPIGAPAAPAAAANPFAAFAASPAAPAAPAANPFASFAH